MPDSHTLASPRRDALLVGLAFTCAWLWLSLHPDAPLHEDTSRDLAFARELADATQHHAHGAWANFAALEQGTSFIDLLALCRLAGLGFVGIDRVMTTVLAASVAVAMWGFMQVLRGCDDAAKVERGAVERGAVAGAIVLLAALPVVAELPVLWQPGLLPLPLVLAHLALWRILRDGSTLDALALAIFTALALDVHIVSVVFVPLVALALGLASRRPVGASLLAALLGVGVLALSSWDALLDNVARLDAHGWLLALLASLLLAWLLGLRLRDRFAALAWSRRIRLALLVEAGLLLALLLASLLDTTPPLAGRYLAPFAPGLALAFGMTLTRTRRAAGQPAGLALALALLGLATFSLRSSRDRSLPLAPAWTLVEFEPVGALLHARGMTWTQLVAQLQGPRTPMMLGMLAAVVEPGSASPTAPEQGLLVLALRSDQRERVRDELPGDAVWLDITDDLRVLVVETSARANRLDAELCRQGHECIPVVLALGDRIAQAHLTAWIDVGPADERSRHRPAIDWLREVGEPDEIQWRIPIRRGAAAHLLLPAHQPEHCAWHFVDVEGFEPAAELPLQELMLDADQAGSVLIARRLDPRDDRCAEHSLLPPAIIELSPAWTQLRALLQPRATRR